jgi:hypothetical protein
MIIIDRFEGDFAVLETDSGMIDVERNILPSDAAEGDVLRLESGVYYADPEATEARRAAMVSRFNRLRRKNND